MGMRGLALSHSTYKHFESVITVQHSAQHVQLHICMTSPLSLRDLSEFIQAVSAGLSVSVDDIEYDGLVVVMKHLLDVKARQPKTDGMFEPLKQMIELLKTYNQEMPDDVHQQLEVCLSVCLCVCGGGGWRVGGGAATVSVYVFYHRCRCRGGL